MDTGSLANRTAVVTGASSGIGRSIAMHLAAAGAHVFAAGRSNQALMELDAEIHRAGGQCTTASIDVRETGQIVALLNSVVGQTQRLDIMVNNAGLEFPATILEGEVEHWRTMLEVNVLAVLVGCQAAVRIMRELGTEGRLVNISSVTAQRNSSGVYGATKHAVNVISATLRDELESDSIRITNVMPGATSTNFARNFPPSFLDVITKMTGKELEFDAGGHLSPEALQDISKELKHTLCSPDDVARAVLFAVTQPIDVNIADIVVRPPRAMTIPH